MKVIRRVPRYSAVENHCQHRHPWTRSHGCVHCVAHPTSLGPMARQCLHRRISALSGHVAARGVSLQDFVEATRTSKRLYATLEMTAKLIAPSRRLFSRRSNNEIVVNAANRLVISLRERSKLSNQFDSRADPHLIYEISINGFIKTLVQRR